MTSMALVLLSQKGWSRGGYAGVTCLCNVILCAFLLATVNASALASSLSSAAAAEDVARHAAPSQSPIDALASNLGAMLKPGSTPSNKGTVAQGTPAPSSPPPPPVADATKAAATNPSAPGAPDPVQPTNPTGPAPAGDSPDEVLQNAYAKYCFNDRAPRAFGLNVNAPLAPACNKLATRPWAPAFRAAAALAVPTAQQDQAAEQAGERLHRFGKQRAQQGAPPGPTTPSVTPSPTASPSAPLVANAAPNGAALRKGNAFVEVRSRLRTGSGANSASTARTEGVYDPWLRWPRDAGSGIVSVPLKMEPGVGARTRLYLHWAMNYLVLVTLLV